MNNKHAILIIAHNNFETLEKIIRLLDNEKNDIFIHIDKKVRKFDFEKFKNIPTKSNIYFVKRIKVNWSAFSQIRCEYNILKAAVNNYDYSFYHLISGADIPLKTSEEIYSFFEKNSGKEFIHFAGKKLQEKNNASYRISVFHSFQELQKNSNKLLRFIAFKLRNISLRIQNLLKINRLKNKNIEIGYGANWFSITGDFAKYALDKFEKNKKMFKHSYCGDEIFLQTILINSKFKNNLYYNKFDDNYISCMRYIDWNRGCPYVFRKEDFDTLINSDYMFARKFDQNIDNEIIEMLYNYLIKRGAKNE